MKPRLQDLEAEIAIESGDAGKLAQYLRTANPVSPEILAILADVLDPACLHEDRRLVFERRRVGNPKLQGAAPHIVRAEIYHEVEALYDERLKAGIPKRGLRKSVLGEIAARRSPNKSQAEIDKSVRAIRSAYETVARMKRRIADGN
jgi:hypothetical protein